MKVSKNRCIIQTMLWKYFLNRLSQAWIPSQTDGALVSAQLKDLAQRQLRGCQFQLVPDSSVLNLLPDTENKQFSEVAENLRREATRLNFIFKTFF